MGNGRETSGCVTANRLSGYNQYNTPTHTLPHRPNSHLPKQPAKEGERANSVARPNVNPTPYSDRAISPSRPRDISICSDSVLSR